MRLLPDANQKLSSDALCPAVLYEVSERKTADFRPSKLPLLSILYSGVSWCLRRGVFSSPFQEPSADRGGGKGLIRQGPLFLSAP